LTAKSPDARLLHRAAGLAVGVALLLSVIKFAAYLLTGSVALLSSLIDSLLDLFASSVNWLAVRVALTPPDAEHRFGHGKAEPLAGIAQAAFISGSAIFLLIQVGERLINPQAPQYGGIGIAVMLVSIALTVLLVLYQRRVIARTQSLAIRADSLHYVGDVLVNGGVIIALLLSIQLGWLRADPLIALAIAIHILTSAWRIGREAFDQLMDRELDVTERARIEAIALGRAGVRGVHELRTRASGRDVFIQLHLVLDGGLPLREAHAIAMAVQKDIAAAYPSADVLIHQDPKGEPGCVPG
jgi:ferrous-iron efflux pump FieF